MHETTAQIVGVDRGEDLYRRVSIQFIYFSNHTIGFEIFIYSVTKRIVNCFYLSFSQFHQLKCTLSTLLQYQIQQSMNKMEITKLKEITLLPSLLSKKQLLPLNPQTLPVQHSSLLNKQTHLDKCYKTESQSQVTVV